MYFCNTMASTQTRLRDWVTVKNYDETGLLRTVGHLDNDSLRPTPVKDRTPSDQLHEEIAFSFVSHSRPGSSSSQRDEIVRPESVPHSMDNLLC